MQKSSSSSRGVNKIAKTLVGNTSTAMEKAKEYEKYCRSESDEAYVTICKNQEEYDKQLLTLSIGMLAVLFAFLKDLVHLDSSIHRLALYSGFISFGLTVAIVLLSFQVSIRALEDVRSYWKKQYDGDFDCDFPERLGSWVKHMNRSAGILFLAGISLAIFFIITNLSNQARIREAEMNFKNLQEGTLLKAPIIKSEERGSQTKAPIQSAPKAISPTQTANTKTK
jgi:hypothetical protein